MKLTKEQVKQMLEDILMDEKPSMNDESRGDKTTVVTASIKGRVMTCYTMEKLLALSKLCGWSFFSMCQEDSNGIATTTIEFYTYGN